MSKYYNQNLTEPNDPAIGENKSETGNFYPERKGFPGERHACGTSHTSSGFCQFESNKALSVTAPLIRSSKWSPRTLPLLIFHDLIRSIFLKAGFTVVEHSCLFSTLRFNDDADGVEPAHFPLLVPLSHHLPFVHQHSKCPSLKKCNLIVNFLNLLFFYFFPK